MKKYIYAMSVNQQELGQQLFNASLPLTEHLTKLYMFPNLDYRGHWKKKIWNFAHRVPKLKSSNKYPEAEFIFEKLSGYADDSYNAIDMMLADYSQHCPERVDGAELETMLNQYFWWLAEELSEHGIIPADKVYNKLDEIGF